jgi:hypothetical protein
MYFRDCKTLSVFERKIPLTLRVQISPRVKTIPVNIADIILLT